MKLLCPLCHRPADPAQVNMAELLAYCPDCRETWNFGAKKAAEEIDDKVLAKPPSGCSREKDVDGIILRASTRSPAAFFLVPFMCVWSGFSLGGIYGTQIVQGKFNLMMSLFGIPFIAGSVLFWSIVKSHEKVISFVSSRIDHPPSRFMTLARAMREMFMTLSHLPWLLRPCREFDRKGL